MTMILIFDGYCGFCTRTVNWLLRLDRRNRLAALPYQLGHVMARYELSAKDCDQAAWAITADGGRHRGAAAINAAVAAALGTNLPMHVYRLPGMCRLQEAVYGWVSRNRHQFRGVTPWCEAHPHARCTSW
ncbi:MAG: DUF393 domain-containing protein [Actinomycetota bacterium]|nr:DUF393 domain-containing protein [Actinomycetota bacterium]